MENFTTEYVAAGCPGHDECRTSIAASFDSVLHDVAGEHAVDFIGRLGRLGHGTIGHVLSLKSKVAPN